MKKTQIYFTFLIVALIVLSFPIYAQERAAIQSIVTTDAENDGRIHEIEFFLNEPLNPGGSSVQDYLDGLWAQGIADDFTFSEDFVVPIGMKEGSEINTFIFILEPIEGTTTAFNVDYTSNPARRINTTNSTGYLLSFAAQNIEDRTRPVLKSIEVGYDGSGYVDQIVMIFTEPMHTPQTSTQGINIPGVTLPANGVWDTATRFRLDVTSSITSLFYHDIVFVAGEVLLRDPQFSTNRVNPIGEYYVEKAIRVAREEVALELSEDITVDISEEAVITAIMVYPEEFLEGLPADLFVDAWLTADPALPEDSQIIIEYNGNPVTTYNVGPAGLAETWLSDLLPIERTYLIGHENLTDVWTLKITGITGEFEDNGIYEAETYTFSATSFFGYDFADPSKVYDNGLDGYDGYDEVEITFNSYQAALDLVALNTSLLLEQAGINNIEATMEYPADIAGILSDYMLDALIEVSVAFPAGTELAISYNDTYLTTYTLAADTDQIYLSEMIPAHIPTRTPLLGHEGLVDVWGIDVLLPYISDTAFVTDLTVNSVTSDDDFASEFLLAEETEEITIDTYSTYKFVYDVPLLIIAGEESVVNVTFETDELGTLGYDDIRFKIEADGPGDVTFSATDYTGTHTFDNIGFWGPATGFALPASYTATTQWTLEFSENGLYDITFSLIEAPDGDVVAGITQDQEIYVEAVPTAVFVDLLWAGNDFMEDLGEGKFFGYNAFAVIQEGVDAVASGGTVNVAAGFYEEAITIHKAGVELLGAQSGVDARSRTGLEETIIDGTGTERQAILIGSDDIVVDGFTIQNPDYADNIAAALIVLSYDHHNNNIAIRNNIMHSPGDTTVGRPWGIFAIEGTKATELVIEQNYIHDILFDNATVTWNATGGMWLWEELYNVTIQNNKIENVSTFGIGISTGITGGLIQGNEISGVGYETSASYPSAIRVGTSNSVIVKENIISDSEGTAMTSGVYLLGSTDVTVIDNNISSSSIGIYARGTVFSGNINSNVLSNNSVQVDDPFELLNLESILANNSFDKAVVVRGSDIQVPKVFSFIQEAITASDVGQTVEVWDGYYFGNVTVNKDIDLVSKNGAAVTILDGDDAGSGLGTVYLTSGRDGVKIAGFHIIGIDGPPGLEKAAVYLQGAQANITIEDNIIEARGDAALMGEWNANNNNIIINANLFTGKTFIGDEPNTGNQFVDPNVARQAIVFGGGAGTTNTQNFTFTNNEIATIAAGQLYGNTLVTLDLVGENVISGNVFSGRTLATALRVRGSGDYEVINNDFDGDYDYALFRQGSMLDATNNWWGSIYYPEIYNQVFGSVKLIPYLLNDTIDPLDPGYDSGGTHANSLDLALTYEPANENIKVEFSVDSNEMVLNPIPGLDPTDPGDILVIASMYQALEAAIIAGDDQAILEAALAIGDDVITEYYYIDGTDKVYLQTINDNDLIKNKYWQRYLVRDDEKRFPDWLTGDTVIVQDNYRTHTNPGTGSVASGWLNDVLGRDLYVRVTLVNNGNIFSIEEAVEIGTGPIVNTNTGLGYPTIQAAIDAADAGHTIEVSAGLFVGNLEINVPDLTLKSVAGYDAIIRTEAGFNAGSGFGGITVLADGVTLDGFRIEQGVPQAVVHTHNSNNVTIKNNKIVGVNDARPRGIDVGYASANSANVVILDNEFELLYCGVYISRATDLEIDANHFEDMIDGAIVFDGTWYYGDINVVNNSATDANYLLYFFGEQGPVTYANNDSLTNTLLTNFGVHNTDKNILYSTIQAAIDGAEDSDTILLSDGTYYENIIIDVPGLTITNASSPVIDGDGSGTVVLITANDVTLEGLTIQNSGTEDTDAGIFLNQVTGCYISGNIIIDNGNGVGIVMGSGNTLIDNEITNSSLYGVVLVGTSGNTIEANEIDTAILDGIALANASEVGLDPEIGSTSNYIKTNTIQNGERDGIFIGENCDNNSITNGNILDIIGSIGISLWRSGEQTITGNTISSTVTGLRLLGSSNNTITGNSIVDNDTGIKVDASWQEGVWYPSENNTISENDIYGNTTYGMRADDPEQTTVVAAYNWWGDATGPEHSINALGQGDAVTDKVLFSPWYFQEEKQTLNGLPELVLSEIGDIYTVTNTPIVIDLTVTYPDLTNYDPAVLTDAVLSTTEAAFPAGTKVIDVLYNGNSILAQDYDLAGSNTHYLSDILGSQTPYGTPLAGHSNLAIDWTFVITGAEEALAEFPVSMQSISYLDRSIGYNELGAPEEFEVTYADVNFPGFADLVVGIPNPIVIEWTESYPLIENIGGARVLNDSKFMIYDDEDNPAYLPSGTTITVTIPSATPVVRTSVLSEEAHTIYGSAIVTQQSDPTTNEFGYLALLEREATIPGQEAEWMVTIEGADAGDYVVKFEAIAVLDIDAGGYPFDGEFIYTEDEFSVEVVAVSPTLYVNHIWEGSSPMQEVEPDKFFGHNAFANIQNAIAAANPGDEILVAAGEYEEIGQIVIDKDLTIIGDSNLTTIIKPAQNIENWFLVEAGNTFDLSEVTLDGEGKNIRAAIRTHGSGSIENCVIRNIGWSQYLGWGIALTWSTPDQVWAISQNVFENIERVGILVDGQNNTAIVTGNTFIGNGDGDWVGYGIEVGDGASAEITGNTIRDYRGVAESDGSTSAAILVTSFFGPEPEALITGNTIEDNTTGIYVGYEENDTSDVTASGNTFNNNRYQVRTTIGVDFDIAAALADNTFDRAVVVREEINTRQNSIIVPAIFSFIQDAIDATDSGNAIDVQAGTYTEQLVIDKGLTVSGDEDAVIKAPLATEREMQIITESSRTFDPIIFIDGGSETIAVTFEGFEIDGNDDPGSHTFTGILSRSADINIAGNHLHSMLASQETVGISVYGGNVVILDTNTIDDFSRNAVSIFDVAYPTVTNNTIIGRGYVGQGYWAQNGIQIVGANTALISDNTISDIGWIWPGTGSSWSATGILPFDSEEVNIDNNILENVQVAIRVVNSNFRAQNNNVTILDDGGMDYTGGIWGNPQGRPETPHYPFDVTSSRRQRTTFRTEMTFEYYDNDLTGDGITDGYGIGIWPDDDGNSVSVTATGNKVINWQIGYDIWGDDDFAANIHNNIIEDNSWGMWNWTNTEVNAIQNYWGDPTGPTHATNPLGAGDIISDLVLYDPWWADEEMTIEGTNDAIIQAIDAINDLGDAYYLGAATRTSVPDYTLFVNAETAELAAAQLAITNARGLGDDTTIDNFINDAIETVFINWNADITVEVVMSGGAEAGAFVEGTTGAVTLYADGDGIEIELPDLLIVTEAYQQMYDTEYLDPIDENGFYDEGNARILKTTEAGTYILYVRTTDAGRGAANVTSQVTRQNSQRTRSQQVPVASNIRSTRSNAVWYRYEWHVATDGPVVDNILLYEELVYQRVSDVDLPETLILFEGPAEVEIGDEHFFYIPNPTGKIQHAQEWYYNISPANATINDLIWESSDPGILSVAENGILTPGELGTATITVKTVDGEHIATTDVSVYVFYGDVNNDWMNAPSTVGGIQYPGGGVEGSDALATLKYSAGDNVFGDNPWAPWRRTRADVKGNPSLPILAYDASLIFQYANDDIDVFPAQPTGPVRGERTRSQIVASPQINIEIIDDMIMIFAEDSTELFGLNISIEHNQFVTLGDAQFNLPESYLTVAHADEFGYHIAIAASLPENIEGYLAMIPVMAEEDTSLNIEVYSNVSHLEFVLAVEANLVSVEDPIFAPENSVSSNYPNPFNPSTTISYSVKETSRVRIDVYNIKGQLVRTLVDEEKNTGQHMIQWHGVDNRGRTVASGVYFYTVSIGDEFRKTQRMMLLK